MAHIAVALIAFERALRCVMPPEHRITRQQRPAVMLRQPRSKLISLIKTAVEPPLFAQRHGQQCADFGIGQPRRRMLAHDLRQWFQHTQIGQMLERMQHAADRRLIIHGSPQPLKRRRLLLAAPAHRAEGAYAGALRAHMRRIGAHALQIGGTSGAQAAAGGRIVA